MRQSDGLIPMLIEKMEINKQHFTDTAVRYLEKRVKVSGGQIYVGQYLNKVLISAEDEAKQMGDEYVSVEHLFLSLIRYPNGAIKEIFREYGITRDRFLQDCLPSGEISVLQAIIRKQPMIHWKNTVMIW